MGTMEINEFNQAKLRLLDTEQLLAFYGIFGRVSSPKAQEMVKGITRELKRRNYTLGEESLNEVDVKALMKGLVKGTTIAGKGLAKAIKVGYPIAKDMVKATWMTSKKVGGAIGDLMDDPEFRKLFTKYVDNPNDKDRAKKLQAYTDGMLSDAPLSGFESVQLKKLRIERVCSIVLGEDFDQDFIYEDVDFTKPSTIKEAYSTYLIEASKGDIKKVLDAAKKAGGTIDGNQIDFGMGSVIDVSIEKGKIKLDGGSSSGVEYFKNVKDAIMAFESTDLEEAVKFWTVTITKKAGKLFKGQTVDVKARNSAEAIKKGLKQMKADPNTVPSGSVDAVLGESIEEASDKDLDIKSIKDLIKNPSPKMIKQYGGKDKYIKMLKSKLAKLESTKLEEITGNNRLTAHSSAAAQRLIKKLKNKFSGYAWDQRIKGDEVIYPMEPHIIRFIKKQPEVATI
jgi:3D (Asp-Asp-Asp) domain-containing protein